MRRIYKDFLCRETVSTFVLIGAGERPGAHDAVFTRLEPPSLDALGAPKTLPEISSAPHASAWELQQLQHHAVFKYHLSLSIPLVVESPDIARC